MANKEGKKGVLVYYDILEQLTGFSDDQIGKIFKAIIIYDKNGTMPTFNDAGLTVAFNFIKPTLDRNKQEYEAKCEKNRQNVQKRWTNSQDTSVCDRIPSNNSYTNDTDNDIDNDNDNEKDIDNDIKKENVLKEKPQKRFVKPTLKEVIEYCKERNNNVNAEKFVDYYSSNGWKVGKNSMKDWKAAIRTWEKNDTNKNQKLNSSQPKNIYTEAEMRSYRREGDEYN